MKKIVFYINKIEKGGAERVITNLANYFSDKYNVSLVLTKKSEIKYHVDKNVNIIFLKSNKISDKLSKLSLVKFFALRNVIKHEKPDLVVSFLPESGFRIAALKRFSKYMRNVPLVISIRNNPYVEYKNKIINRLMRFLYRKIDGLVVQTPDCLNYFNDILKCDKEVIPNPLSDMFLNTKTVSKRKNEIVAVNRLTPQKNVFMLINAFEAFLKNHDDYHLTIYGEGPLKNDINDYIKLHNLVKKITLAGNVDDVEKRIIDARMYVLCSDYEGMPNSLMEALSLGIPSIATDSPIGGCRMLIENNVNGVLIPVGNEEALVCAMEKLANDTAFSDKISIEAKKIINEYSPIVINKKWDKYLSKFVKKG